MIQDIAPDRLNNAFMLRVPAEGDQILYFDEDGRLYVRLQDGHIGFPAVTDISPAGAVYLFSVNKTGFFLAPQETDISLEDYEFKTVRELRDRGGGKELFVAFTAWHLWRWYTDNRFCGRCGHPTRHHETERALQCCQCGQVIYPRINPAVIVGVIKGDCLLITRYKTGYKHNALVAGFTEIGETVEQTVQREVMEETGIRVKNIRYYKSQPWGMAQDLLMGFYCEADGNEKIRMDANELKYAEWVRQEEIVLQPNDLSLTNEMMKLFRNNGREGCLGGF